MYVFAKGVNEGNEEEGWTTYVAEGRLDPSCLRLNQIGLCSLADNGDTTARDEFKEMHVLIGLFALFSLVSV